MAIEQLIYLDHAASTPVASEVLLKMLRPLGSDYGNPSSMHLYGQLARRKVEACRRDIAAHLSAKPDEIIFTSGGTEADNIALRGVLTDPSMGLVTGATEHEAVLQTAAYLKRKGHEVVTLAPGIMGTITPRMVRDSIGPGTRLVSIAYVNNETGAVAQLPEISKVCRAQGVLLHTDAVQAASTMDLNVDRLGVDLLSLSGHKIYGPQGIGAVYVRTGVQISPIIVGGSQERNRRAGTENVAAIVGLRAAMKAVSRGRVTEAKRIRKLRMHLLARLQADLPGAFIVNTPPDAWGAPHILNIAFTPVNGRAVDGEMLLLGIGMEGIMVSAGSACSSGAALPSHVLSALGLDHETAAAAIRFSLGRTTTEKEIDHAATCVTRVVTRMRRRRRRRR